MPTERLSMRRIRDILRLKYAQGLSDRAAALSLGLSKGTVGNYLARFSQAGLSWPLPPDVDEVALERALFKCDVRLPDAQRPLPDWVTIAREKKQKGVTLQLLWQEYCRVESDGHSYSQFAPAATQNPPLVATQNSQTAPPGVIV